MVGLMRNNFVFGAWCVRKKAFFDQFARDGLAERSSNLGFGE
jgi:hypothetical protein